MDHCVSISVNNSAECPLRLQRAFFEICCAVLKGAVKVETAANAVKRVAVSVMRVGQRLCVVEHCCLSGLV